MRGDVMAMHYAGKHVDEIARKFIPGPSTATIKQWIKIEKRQWPKSHMGGNFPWEIIEAVLSCISAGFTQTEASYLIGVNQTTISQWARKAEENKLGGGGVRGHHSKSVRQAAARLVYGGAPSADVAKLLDITPTEVRQYAANAGIYPDKYSRALPLMPTVPVQLA